MRIEGAAAVAVPGRYRLGVEVSMDNSLACRSWTSESMHFVAHCAFLPLKMVSSSQDENDHTRTTTSE